MQLSEIFKEYGIPNLMFHIPMERIQESGIAVVGFEVDSTGLRTVSGTRWTGANSLCTTVA